MKAEVLVLSTKNLTRTGPGSDPHLCRERSATNYLNLHTLLVTFLLYKEGESSYMSIALRFLKERC